MTKLRGSLILSLMLSAGGAMALWAADATPSETTPATAPATTTATATNAANIAEAAAHRRKAWDLNNQKKYQQAAEENDAALALDPNSNDSKLLKRIINDNLGGEGTGVAGGTINRLLLNKDDINRIKINELSDDDLKTVRGSIPPKDVEDFWKEVILKDPTWTATTKADHDKFVRYDNLGGQIKAMQSEQTPKYYEKVKIASDPANLVVFKTLVQPFVLSNCATANCHGKNNRGFPIVLQVGQRDLNTVAYTNFYILNNLTYGGNPLIDRNNATNSLLIQYATDPKSGIASPHPGKLSMHPFANVGVPNAQKLEAWIKTLCFPAPNYGVTYQMPAPPAATEPAAAPIAPAPAAVPDKP